MKTINALWGVPLISVLAACGGGSSGSSTPAPTDPAPEGFYSGDSDIGRNVAGVVLDNGDYYFLYGTESDGLIAPEGVLQGRGVARGDRFTSSNTRDFSFTEGRVDRGRLDATFVREQYLTGDVIQAGTGESVGFSLAYDDSYERTPDLNEDAGVYEGVGLSPGGDINVTIDLDAQGDFSGIDDVGCVLEGVVTPRQSGDVYDLTVAFTGAACTYNGEALHGIALAQDGGLIAMAPNADRTGGIFFVGARQ